MNNYTANKLQALMGMLTSLGISKTDTIGICSLIPSEKAANQIVKYLMSNQKETPQTIVKNCTMIIKENL